MCLFGGIRLENRTEDKREMAEPGGWARPRLTPVTRELKDLQGGAFRATLPHPGAGRPWGPGGSNRGLQAAAALHGGRGQWPERQHGLGRAGADPGRPELLGGEKDKCHWEVCARSGFCPHQRGAPGAGPRPAPMPTGRAGGGGAKAPTGSWPSRKFPGKAQGEITGRGTSQPGAWSPALRAHPREQPFLSTGDLPLGPDGGGRGSPWPYPAAGAARAPPRTPPPPTPAPCSVTLRGGGTAFPRSVPQWPLLSGGRRDTGWGAGEGLCLGARDSASASLRRWQKIVLFYLVKHSFVSGSSEKTP
ncbi:translation initiation factor IF-2-like [Myotis myotis]|uniref:translation initiation factor IF-2-like n=1 Tax=Myotis myotis TaxID=51298 RepID=UPI0017496FC5|nr:translation initiation factor IF-2-like [Myotis myotis]XP_036195381.1 translation initiation factor IF-2-like [Myotis myotis]